MGEPNGRPYKPSACRCLFGPVDHNEINDFIDEHHRAEEERARQRWGFDFRTGEPVVENGQYEWTPVGSADLQEIPAVYRYPMVVIEPPVEVTYNSLSRSERQRSTEEMSDADVEQLQSLSADRGAGDLDEISGVSNDAAQQVRQQLMSEPFTSPMSSATGPNEISVDGADHLSSTSESDGSTMQEDI